MLSRRLLVPVLWLRVPVRGSVWPPHFVDPIYTPQEQAALDPDERKKLTFVPVKAARNNKTSSVFFDETIFRLTKMIMRCGRMHLARYQMDRALEDIKNIQRQRLRNAKSDSEREEIETNPVTITKQAIVNMTPVVMVTPIKRGGATYQVPKPITPKYGEFMAMKWLLDSIKERPKPQKENFYTVLARELLTAYNNEGKVVKKKVDMHRLCEANKAYAHYRWG